MKYHDLINHIILLKSLINRPENGLTVSVVIQGGCLHAEVHEGVIHHNDYMIQIATDLHELLRLKRDLEQLLQPVLCDITVQGRTIIKEIAA